jgi:hypothetical protein
MSEPSPSRRRFASESSRVPQVLHRKHSMCHRLPAGNKSYTSAEFVGEGILHVRRHHRHCSQDGETRRKKERWPYLVRMLSPLRGSIWPGILANAAQFTTRVPAASPAERNPPTSPHPLHGYTISSSTMGESGNPPPGDSSTVVMVESDARCGRGLGKRNGRTRVDPGTMGSAPIKQPAESRWRRQESRVADDSSVGERDRGDSSTALLGNAATRTSATGDHSDRRRQRFQWRRRRREGS